MDHDVGSSADALEELVQRPAIATSISVVIPAYNCAATLNQAIDSIFGQTLAPSEIIVVDDGSTDGTADLLVTYGDRVRILRQEHKGLADARNAGCNAAKGNYIAFIDGDDIANPDRFELQMAAFASDPDIVLVYSDFSSFGVGVTPAASFIASYYPAFGRAGHNRASLLGLRLDLRILGKADYSTRVIGMHVGNLSRQLMRDMFVHPPTVTFRRSLFSATGIFDASLRNLCDWDWLIRASMQGPFAYLDHPLLAYRLSAGQLSRSADASQQRALDSITILERYIGTSDLISSSALRSDLAEYYFAAANELAMTDGRRSRTLLNRSIELGRLDKSTLKVLVKSMLPCAMRIWLLSLRDWKRDGTPNKD